MLGNWLCQPIHIFYIILYVCMYVYFYVCLNVESNNVKRGLGVEERERIV